MPPRCLVYAFEWEKPDPDDRETLVTLSFLDDRDGTRLVLDQGMFATRARYDLHEAGWTETLDRLAAHLQQAASLEAVESEWTVERHLLGKPDDVVALCDRFIELVGACGPFTYSVTKTAITLKGGRRGFAGLKPKKASLDGYLDLERRVEDSRIRRSGPYTKRLFVHHFRIVALPELDAEFAGWLREAYAVGAGAHLDSSKLET